MANALNLAEIFKSDAGELRQARETAIRIHPTDMRAAGNQVEQAVRDYLKRMLPPRYYVTNGHVIDSSSRVSPQLDIIIADNLSLPSLLTTKDGTEYVPITSVYAIGEVKSTYYQAKNYFKKFHSVLQQISEMDRPLVENTVHGGLKAFSKLDHIVWASPYKFLNNLFSFLIFVDGGDFDFRRVAKFLASVAPEFLPNISILLNRGVVAYANPDGTNGMEFRSHPYPIEVSQSGSDWCFFGCIGTNGGSPEGANLAALYTDLMRHLSNSRLEPPDAYRYTKKLSQFPRSSLIWARDDFE